ncbi:MAG: phosphate ABC transporter permease PstA [Pseudomonadota bacterium]
MSLNTAHALTPAAQKRGARRQRLDRMFRFAGLAALMMMSVIVVLLLGAILWRGLPAFTQHQVRLDITFPAPQPEAVSNTDYGQLIRQALAQRFPDAAPEDIRALRKIISPSARLTVRDALQANPDWAGQTHSLWLAVSAKTQTYLRSPGRATELGERDPKVLTWLADLNDNADIRRAFRATLFQRGDSRRAQSVGILGALAGSALTLTVTLVLAFPIGLASAIYLQEFAPKSRLVDLLEVNINNLAAIPSILYGLLGLAVFINVFHLPRATPLVGGMTLALMTLPTVIISSRAALAAVPKDLRAASLSLGASHVQTVFHHILPSAMPGVLTGTILAVAQALGETAPLLLIGMLAFIVDVPTQVTDVATALPAQIFLWAENPDEAFSDSAAAAIVVLLLMLLSLNAAAVFLRTRLEKRRW